jgi:hypothetical protein
MFKVDAPVRISIPGHSMSGADGVGEAAWVTPGVALENKPAKRLPNELSDDPTLEADEQPHKAPALNMAIARRAPRFRSSSCPGGIENTPALG